MAIMNYYIMIIEQYKKDSQNLITIIQVIILLNQQLEEDWNIIIGDLNAQFIHHI